jgi:hypothetical protein
MLGLGWICLAEEPGHFFVAGAVCQPWQANVVFSRLAEREGFDYSRFRQLSANPTHDDNRLCL